MSNKSKKSRTWNSMRLSSCKRTKKCKARSRRQVLNTSSFKKNTKRSRETILFCPTPATKRRSTSTVSRHKSLPSKQKKCSSPKPSTNSERKRQSWKLRWDTAKKETASSWTPSFNTTRRWTKIKTWLNSSLRSSVSSRSASMSLRLSWKWSDPSSSEPSNRKIPRSKIWRTRSKNTKQVSSSDRPLPSQNTASTAKTESWRLWASPTPTRTSPLRSPITSSKKRRIQASSTTTPGKKWRSSRSTTPSSSTKETPRPRTPEMIINYCV